MKAQTGEIMQTSNTKIIIFQSNVISALFYGCETWRMAKTDEQKLDVFSHRSVCRILKISWPINADNKMRLTD